MIFEFIIDKHTDIKTFLFEKKFSYRTINRLLIEKKNLFINEKVYDKNYILNKGDKLKVILKDDKSTVLPVNKPIDIVYEDDLLLVVNKPKNLSTIPSIAHFNDNLAGRVLHYFHCENLEVGIHAVNRLDLLTSGLVIFAKSKFIHSLLSKTEIIKKYRCTVTGILQEKQGVISKKIARESASSIKRIISNAGKTAITEYSVIKEENGNSLLDVRLFTGRTHQIRVHFASISHPLIGDVLYGTENGEFDLCSYYLKFHLSFNDKTYEFKI